MALFAGKVRMRLFGIGLNDMGMDRVVLGLTWEWKEPGWVGWNWCRGVGFFLFFYLFISLYPISTPFLSLFILFFTMLQCLVWSGRYPFFLAVSH